jgi:hypothetical protein
MKELLTGIAEVTDKYMAGGMTEFAAVVMIMGLTFKAYDNLKARGNN